MTEKEVGEALLRVDSAGLAGVADGHRHTWAVLERDRQRVRFLTWLSVGVWVLASVLVWIGLVNYGLVFPAQAKLVHDIEDGTLTPAQRDEAQRLILISFQKGTLVIAFSVAVMAVAALCTVFLILTSRRATVRQLNAGLAEIAAQLRQLRPTAPGGPAAPG